MPESPSKNKNPTADRKRTRSLWTGLIGLAVSSALIAGAWLQSFLSNTSFKQSQNNPEEAEAFDQGEQLSTGIGLQVPRLTRSINVLVLGTKVLTSDVKDSTIEPEGYHSLVNSLDGLSDTMLLLRFHPQTQKVVALSIPRDTRTQITGYGQTKINEANFYGGAALSARAVSDLLDGVQIDRYVRINVQGMEALIDALGGVTVNIPHDMQYQDDSQHLYIHLQAGEQHLNGEQALQFLRFRYGELGDIGRVRRQQLFIQAMIKQTLKPSTLLRVPQILSVIQSHLDTNLTNEELVTLASFAAQVNRSDVQMLLVPGRFSQPGEYRASYWIPDETRIHGLMAQYFDLPSGGLQATSPDLLRVTIQASPQQGDDSINTLVDRLTAAGYRHVYVDELSNRILNRTRIVAQQGDRVSATAIHDLLGLGKVRVESTGDFYSDITIQLGQDWVERQH